MTTIARYRIDWTKRRKRSKYGNRKVTLNGVTFDSQHEAQRYLVLDLARRQGQISELAVHPRYRLEVNGKLVCGFWPDFQYVNREGKLVVEDAKSAPTKTRAYRIKVKLFKALYGHDVVEV